MRIPLLMAAAALLGAAEIVLVDGRVIEGELASAPDGEIAVRIGEGANVVIRCLPRGQVADIRPGPGPGERRRAPLLERAAQLARAGTADAWWELACDARRSGEDGLARAWCEETLVRDRHHPAARAALGFALFRGIWLKAGEVAAARGLILYGGRWRTWAEREQEREAEAAARRRAAAAARQREERLAREARTVAEAAEPWPLGVTTIGPATRVIWWPQAPCHAGWNRNGGRLDLAGRSGGWWWRLNWGD